MTIKNILVPTDFTKKSFEAARAAVEVAKKNQARVVLLHVERLKVVGSKLSDLNKPEEFLSMAEMTDGGVNGDFEELFNSDTRPARIETKIIYGSTLKTLTSFEQEENFDLMVLGQSRFPHHDGFLFGSLSSRIIHKTKLPVLTIKNRLALKETQKVLVVSNLHSSTDQLLNKLQLLDTLGEPQHIEMIRISTPEDFMTDESFDSAVERVKKLDNLYEYVFSNVNASGILEGLTYHASKIKADMIVIVGKRHPEKAYTYYPERITEDVLDNSLIPILVLV